MIAPSDADWPEVVATAARTAVRWAGEGQFHYYSELADEVNSEHTDAGLEAYGHPMNRLLYDIVMTSRAFDPGSPMLSAVVVLKDQDNRQPGGGFWELGNELGLYHGGSGSENRAGFWGQQFAECTKFWTRSRQRDFDRWLRTNGPVVYG